MSRRDARVCDEMMVVCQYARFWNMCDEARQLIVRPMLDVITTGRRKPSCPACSQRRYNANPEKSDIVREQGHDAVLFKEQNIAQYELAQYWAMYSAYLEGQRGNSYPFKLILRILCRKEGHLSWPQLVNHTIQPGPIFPQPRNIRSL